MAPDRANHAIRDGNYPVVYIAADHGLYKYFPDSGEVFLMKSITSAEQGWMVGYGALTREVPVAGVLELVVLPVIPQGGIGSDQDFIRHFVPGDGWSNIVPPAPAQSWTGISVSPHDPNKWIIWRYALEATVAMVFVTSDNGAHWARVEGSGSTFSSTRFQRFEWSRHTPDFVWGIGTILSGSVETQGDVFYGNPFTGLDTIVGVLPSKRYANWYGMAVQENGDLHARGGERNPYPGAWIEPPVAASPPDEPGHGPIRHNFVVVPSGEPYTMDVISLIATGNQLGVVHGPSRANHHLYKQESYQSGVMEDTGVDLDASTDLGAAEAYGYLAVTQGMRYWIGRPEGTEGIRELTNPFASPSILPSYGEGFTVGSIRADMQTRTALAAHSRRTGAGQATFYLFADGQWSTLAGPEGANPAGMSLYALEPIVRGEG